MKTTTEVLDEIAQKNGWKDFTDVKANHKVSQTVDVVIVEAMIAYASHVRDEDRKVVAENAEFIVTSGSEEFSETSYTAYGNDFIEIDKSSIINAPKLELK